MPRDTHIRLSDELKDRIKREVFLRLMEWGLIEDVFITKSHELSFTLKLTHPCRNFPETGNYADKLYFVIRADKYLADDLSVDVDKIIQFAQEARDYLETIEGLRKVDINPSMTSFNSTN